MFDSAAEGTQPVAQSIRDQLLEPFIAATRAALGEMAGAELAVRAVFQAPYRPKADDIAVEVELSSAREGPLVLSFPAETAAAFTRRILAGVAEPDDSLIRDCVAEIANVVAGQAKALLAAGPYRFTFSVPKMAAEPAARGQACLTVLFGSEHGDFALYLRLPRG